MDAARRIFCVTSEDEATAWFERLYADAEAGLAEVPWAYHEPNTLLAEWAESVELAGDGAPGLVVGCGYGDDAEYLASRGFSTTAFDIAPSAIRAAQHRFPSSRVAYSVADLLSLPAAYHAAFAFVVEIFTVQALPLRLRPAATAAVADTVAPGGRLFVVARAREDDDPLGSEPPWPLSRSELDAFGRNGLRLEQLERVPKPDGTGSWWRAEFRR
jgi:SAM-dependent methyltransferase